MYLLVLIPVVDVVVTFISGLSGPFVVEELGFLVVVVVVKAIRLIFFLFVVDNKVVSNSGIVLLTAIEVCTTGLLEWFIKLLGWVTDTTCLEAVVVEVVEGGTDGRTEADVPFTVAGTKIVFEFDIVGGYLGNVKVTDDNLVDDVVLRETVLEMNGWREAENLDLATVDFLLDPWTFEVVGDDVMDGDGEVLVVVVKVGCVITEYPGVVVEEVGCISPGVTGVAESCDLEGDIDCLVKVVRAEGDTDSLSEVVGVEDDTDCLAEVVRVEDDTDSLFEVVSVDDTDSLAEVREEGDIDSLAEVVRVGDIDSLTEVVDLSDTLEEKDELENDNLLVPILAVVAETSKGSVAVFEDIKEVIGEVDKKSTEVTDSPNELLSVVCKEGVSISVFMRIWPENRFADGDVALVDSEASKVTKFKLCEDNSSEMSVDVSITFKELGTDSDEMLLKVSESL